MPLETALAHRNVQSVGSLPFITNTTPTTTDPMFVQGSTDLLTSISGILQRRPGFSDAVEVTPTVFNNLQRLFTWDRFDGTFYVMACDINSSGFAQVYQMTAGGTSFISVYTDTSAIPFDFVVSNNTLYFSNGFSAKKWDPVNGVSNWGIAIGSVNSSVSAYCGTGADGGGGNPWLNPTNVQGAPNTVYTTVTIAAGPNLGVQSNALNATNYGFAVATANSVVGIQVTLTGLQSSQFFALYDREFVNVYLQNAGSTIGTFKSAVLPLVAGNVVLGSSSDTWGTTLSPGIVNSASFGIQVTAVVNNTGFGGTKTVTFSLDAAQITVFQLGGPAVSVAAGAGTFTATAGYVYVFCYGNSNTGHISSPTLPSNNTGVFTNKANVSITLTASTDAQVNQIRLFRTTDGGGGIYFELPTSPYPNSSGAVTDSSTDANLQIGSIAPTPTFNDPPTPMQGMIYFSGRIWGFKGNKVYFSGLEEINQGVPEESFPSGIAGNFWTFDQPVQGLGLAGGVNNQVLGIFCGGRIYGISGNTLDTFRRFLVSARRGCRSRTCISMLGGMCAWVDSSLQIWVTDGNTLKEIGIDIRPTLNSTVPANFTNCAITFHAAGSAHWLVCSFNGTMLVYDLDMEQWMPPWIASAQYIFSGETSPGNYVLMAATATKALQQNVTKFNDNGVTYQPVIRTNLFSMVPDYGKRFSYIGVGSYDQPSRTGVPWTVQVDTNTFTPVSVGLLTDDDPTVTSPVYAPLAAAVDPGVAFNRKQGVNLLQNVYQTGGTPSSRWAGLKITLANADQQDKIYNYYLAYKELGGR